MGFETASSDFQRLKTHGYRAVLQYSIVDNPYRTSYTWAAVAAEPYYFTRSKEECPGFHYRIHPADQVQEERDSSIGSCLMP